VQDLLIESQLRTSGSRAESPAQAPARPVRKIVVFTGAMSSYSVRKGIAELMRQFPAIDWLVCEHQPSRPVSKLVRSQIRNVRKHGWRWIPYQAADLAARIAVRW